MTREEMKVFLAPLPDESILGLTLYGEARGEPIEGQIAVACAIRNRVNDSKHRWGTTYRAVCLQPKQFSCWNDSADANHAEVLRAATLLLTNGVVPPLLEQVAWIALGIARGALLDSVKGANHYHVVGMTPRPSWAQTYVPICQRGHHAFYKLA